VLVDVARHDASKYGTWATIVNIPPAPRRFFVGASAPNAAKRTERVATGRSGIFPALSAKLNKLMRKHEIFSLWLYSPGGGQAAGLLAPPPSRDGRMSRGERIAHAINARGVRKMLNLALDLGVDESAISRWKKGGPISLESAARLARTLDVSLDWIVLGRGEMEHHKKIALRSEELKLIRLLRHWSGDSTEHLLTFLAGLRNRR
jgi:transcriptional regulator with XRE-family HTH domain